jgi:hypothetical protein
MASTSIDAVSAFTRVAFAAQAVASRAGVTSARDLYPSFTASRYTFGHSIAPHDDVSVAPVELADGSFEWHERAFAGVYYLTRDDWNADVDGGAFEDLHDVREHYGGPNETMERTGDLERNLVEPKFNRLVVFRVPRVHAVRPVISRTKKRHAVFGWWYRRRGADDAHDALAPPAQKERRTQKKRQRKLQ